MGVGSRFGEADRVPPGGPGGLTPVLPQIAADRMPVPPTRQPFEPVEFENLTVTPYVDNGRCQGRGRCNARMAFSLRASGLKAGRPAAPAPKAAA